MKSYRHNRNRKAAHCSLSVESFELRQLLSAVTSPIDGVGNNQTSVLWGSTGTELRRLAEAAYSDGVSSPSGADRLSAREVSNNIVAQIERISNDRNLTDFVWMWGQFIDHDMDLTDPVSPLEQFYVSVPAGDVWFDPNASGNVQIELNRSKYVEGEVSSDGKRQQINSITAFIDGSVVYGSDIHRANQLRTFSDGHLKTSDGNLLPYNEDGFDNAGGDSASLFLAGDVRANENIALTSMHTIWVREHNRLADELAAENPHWSDQTLYEQARALVAAEIQVITYNEFLPALLGSGAIAPYAGYDSSVNPGIANEFSTAAFRFGHSLLSPELQRLDEHGNWIPEGPISLSSAFFNPAALQQTGVEPLLRGAARQAAQELDVQIVDDVRNFLFGPPGAGGLDLASLNIQRGRDHGLADYNTTRAALGLGRVESFSQITSNPDVVYALEQTYGNVDNIDLWVGGLAEDHLPGSSMGATFTSILVNQFERLRDGDRFWYENVFSGEQLASLRQTKLSEVIQRNSHAVVLQSNVFFMPNTEIVELDFKASGLKKVTVRAVDGVIEVIDDVKHSVVFCRDANDIGGLILTGNDRIADRLLIDASVTSDMLPLGITFRGGSVGLDRLVVRGTMNADTITIDGQQISVNGLDILFQNVHELMVEACDGDDTVSVLHPCVNKIVVDGGSGDDVLLGGSSNEELYGGPGNDLLRGGDGDDLLNGGPGADQLYGGGGQDRLIGGAGFDLLVQDGDENSAEVMSRYAEFLDRFYNLRTMPNDYFNWGGRGERWFYSNIGWMFITPDGTIRQWDRKPGANGAVIAKVDPECHRNVAELCEHSTPFSDEDSVNSLTSLARDLDRDLELRFWGNYIYNWGGRKEKWIPGRNAWYFITKDGRLYRWDGSRDAEGTLVAELDVMFYSRPDLLHNAF